MIAGSSTALLSLGTLWYKIVTGTKSHILTMSEICKKNGNNMTV